MTGEQLLEEAKRRYPVGTRFCPAHISYNTLTDTRVIKDSNFAKYSEGMDSIQCLSSIGNNAYYSIVYHQGHWAKIIDEQGNVLEYNSNSVNNNYSIY